jgi:hypothetical protein
MVGFGVVASGFIDEYVCCRRRGEEIEEGGYGVERTYHMGKLLHSS